MSDHHRIGVGSGLHIVTDFQRFVQVLSRLALLLILIWNDGHVNRPEAIFITIDVFLQRLNELIHHRRWHHNARHNLLRLLHPQQEVHDEFMLPLQHNGAGGEDSAGNVCRYECADMGVTDFLALWAFVF